MILDFKTIVITLAAFIPTGLSIKCFQCNSAEDRRCIDIGKNSTTSLFLKECTGNFDKQEAFCRKFVTYVVDTKETRVIRSCGWIIDDNTSKIDFCGKKDTDFIYKANCGCYSDRCNGASYLSFNQSIILFSLIPYLLKCLLIR